MNTFVTVLNFFSGIEKERCERKGMGWVRGEGWGSIHTGRRLARSHLAELILWIANPLKVHSCEKGVPQ